MGSVGAIFAVSGFIDDEYRWRIVLQALQVLHHCASGVVEVLWAPGTFAEEPLDLLGCFVLAAWFSGFSIGNVSGGFVAFSSEEQSLQVGTEGFSLF